MSFFLITLLALLSSQVWGAFNPATDRAQCRDTDNICLTSFVWCARSTDGVRGCTYPPHAYPLYDRDYPSNPALLTWSATYNLTWANTDPAYPVLVQWDLDPISFGLIGDQVTWSRNVTDPYFEFTFAELTSEFPTSTYNVTPAEIYGSVGIANSMRISQPERPVLAGSPSYFDYSDQFLIVSSWVEPYMETQRVIASKDTHGKWSLGVGVGVGVGVPLLMAAVFAGGWWKGKKKQAARMQSIHKHSESS